MRAAVGVFYWVVVALLALNAIYVSVAESRLWPGLLVPVALVLFGLWWPRLGYSGAGLIVFGAYPALLVTRSVADQVVGMDWSCSEVAFDGISNPSGGPWVARWSPSTWSCSGWACGRWHSWESSCCAVRLDPGTLEVSPIAHREIAKESYARANLLAISRAIAA